MKRLFLLLIMNLSVFMAIRYLSLISAFLLGMGASDHYKFESYVYLPGTVMHLAILLVLAFSNRKDQSKISSQYIIITVVLVFLSIAGFLNIVPYSIIPY
jgi:hypothetical protein